MRSYTILPKLCTPIEASKIEESSIGDFGIVNNENGIKIIPPKTSEYQYEIFDISGRIIATGKSSSNKLVTIYQKGIFLARISQGSQMITKKIILQ